MSKSVTFGNSGTYLNSKNRNHCRSKPGTQGRLIVQRCRAGKQAVDWAEGRKRNTGSWLRWVMVEKLPNASCCWLVPLTLKRCYPAFPVWGPHSLSCYLWPGLEDPGTQQSSPSIRTRRSACRWVRPSKKAPQRTSGSAGSISPRTGSWTSNLGAEYVSNECGHV